MSSKLSKGPNFRQALSKKGFHDQGKGKDHHWMVLYVDGKKTHIKTKVSRGSKDIPRRVFSAIYKQLNMPNHAYLLEYLKCPKSYEDYIQMLQENDAL